MHARLRPFNKYLLWELERHPLPSLPFMDASRLVQALQEILSTANPETQRKLLSEVRTLATALGLARVFDSWGEALELLMAER